MSSLIQFAFEALQEAIATEIRRLGRENQMTALNSHPDPEVSSQAPIERPVTNLPSTVDKLIAVADAEWKLDIVEPLSPKQQNGASRIDQYIRGSLGLGWNSAEVGPEAKPNIPYTKNGMFQWCGAFVAFIFGSVGLNAQARKKNLASTYRLHTWAKGNARWIDPKNLQIGDIVVVGPKDSQFGEHVTLCCGVREDSIDTYEGNASGPGPKGDKREGVIKRTRPFFKPGMPDREYRILFGVRPPTTDFV